MAIEVVPRFPCNASIPLLPAGPKSSCNTLATPDAAAAAAKLREIWTVEAEVEGSLLFVSQSLVVCFNLVQF